MQQNKTEPLFDLVKSLSKTEKRYFSTNSQQRKLKGENNYLLLFDELIKFDVYNEAALKLKVVNSILEKDFTFTKSYLYKMLLESLNDFHREKLSFESVLNELTLSVEILYNKSLYVSALKLCKKGLKNATLYECFEHKLIIEKWHYKILEKLNKENIDIYEQNTNDELEKIKNNLEYKIISDKVYRHILTLGVSRSKKEINELKKLMQSPLLKLENKAQGLNAKIFYYNTKGLSAYFEKDYQKSKNYYLRSLQILTLNEKFAHNNAEIYISTYNNYIISNTHIGDYKEVEKGMSHLKNYAANLREGNLKITTFLNLLSVELPFYITAGKFTEAFDALDNIISIQLKYGNVFNPVQNRFIQYFIAYVYFGNDRFKDALVWLNKIINSPNIKERETLFVFTRILKLLAHYELRDFDYLESQLRSVKTYLSKTERNYQIENTSIEMLKELIVHPENEKEIAKKYKPQYEHYFKDNYNIFGYFNFISWIDSKIDQKSYNICYNEFIAKIY